MVSFNNLLLAESALASFSSSYRGDRSPSEEARHVLLEAFREVVESTVKPLVESSETPSYVVENEDKVYYERWANALIELSTVYENNFAALNGILEGSIMIEGVDRTNELKIRQAALHYARICPLCPFC